MNNDLMKLGIGMGIMFAVYKFGKFQPVKAAALGVIGIAIAKRVPYVNEII